MFGLPFGVLVEGAVSVLLAVTIGYCVVLNSRLKRLHADRGALQQMVDDLVRATTLANSAVGELKATASEAEMALTARLEEAERFGIELANHVAAGQSVLQRISQVAAAAQTSKRPVSSAVPASSKSTDRPVRLPPAPANSPEVVMQPPPLSKLQAALQQLAARDRSKADAA